MKLPISMIYHEVKDGIYRTGEISEQLCGRPLFYSEDVAEYDCILYEGDGKKVFRCLRQNTLLICTLWQGDMGKHPIMILKEGYSLSWVSNVLHRLFDRWDQWERKIQELLYRKASLHDFLEVSCSCFGFPITIMNRDFQLIALAGGSNYFSKNGIYEVKEGEKLPQEQVNQFKLDPDYLNVEKKKTPFIWPPSAHLPFPSLCMNLFYQDIYCARVVVFSAGEIHSWTGYLLEVLVGYLEIAYMQVAEFPGEIAETVEIMKTLLSERGADKQDILKLLSLKNWEDHDQYQVAVFQLSAQDIANETAEYFRQELSRNFPFCLSVVKDQRIVLLINRSALVGDEKEFRQQISLFIREGNFRVGFSNIFTEIEHLYSYYQQAEIALRYGNLKNPMIWQHQFDDYAFSYFLDKGVEQLSSEYLKPKELLILEEYDRRNRTELYETLKVYLKNRESAVQTAKEMFVQRGTILYRVSRIEQLTGIHWDDYERKIFLSLAFVMEDRYNHL